MELAPTLGPTTQAIGGIVVFLVLLSVMVFVHELGHFLAARRAGVKVEEFAFGLPPRIWATRRGETEYAINLLPLGGYCRMQGEDDPTEPRSLSRAPKLWRLVILAAGPAMNFILAILIFTAAYATGWPTVTQSEVQVVSVAAGLPSAAAGLRDGDVILALNGQTVKTTADLRRIAEEVRGRTVPVEVRRDGQPTTLSITPRATWPSGEGPLGVSINDRPTKVEPVSYPIPESFVRAVRQTGDVAVATFYLPVQALKGYLPWSAVRPVGPVGIYSITSQAAVETVQSGWAFPILSVAALLSAGLGIANLLPIPGLDGGRLLFLLIETVRGRRIDPQKEGMIHFVGIAILFSLIIAITFVDISSPINIDWGAP